MRRWGDRLVQQPEGVTLQNQVIADFGRGRSLETESECERFELFKMASKMATPH